MELFSVIPLPYRLIFIAVIFASAGAFGWFKGCQHVQAQLEAEKQSQAVLVAQQEAKTAQIIEKHDQISNEIQNEYATQLVKIQEAYNAKTSPAAHIVCTDSVRQPTDSNPGSVPTNAPTSKGVDAAPSDALVAGLPEACTKVTEQLEQLQQWIREVTK